MFPRRFDATLNRVLCGAMIGAALAVFTGTARAAPDGKSVDQAPLRPHRLRCEYLINPLGIDEPQPRLSWALESPRRGETQTAYQILVASTPEDLAANRGDLWDSDKVAADNTAHIEYAGVALASGQPAWWKVRSWDRDGNPGPWSEPASWEMGLLDPKEWHARWIARNTSTSEQPLPLLRRDFKVAGKVKRARAYVCGLGYCELSINGRRVGDSSLDPGYTRYDKRVLYVTYDVTDSLREGDNVVGAMLGNGWFNVSTAAPWGFNNAPWRASPRLLVELRIELEDGRTQVIASDTNWKTTEGPITFSCIYGGESYDARREQAGWNEPGFDDAGWQAAELVDPPAGSIVAQLMPAIKVSRELTPVAVTEPEPGIFVFDFGQNLAGLAELTVSGAAGAEVSMTYSEHLNGDGRADQQNIAQHVWAHGRQQRFQTDTYTLKGKGVEKWHSRFTYHGFRYVEVRGAPSALTADNLRASFMHSAVAEVGSFECSNPLLNQIWRNARWSYLSNLQGIPTDCPHREKNGWTGDAHLACEFGLLNFDGAAVYTKWINDLADEQQRDGRLPGIVPTGGWGYDWGNGPAWDSAYLLIPEYLRVYCGDERLLDRQYEGHRRYVDYLSRVAEDGIVSIGLGDWCPWKAETPAAITSTAYYYRDAQIVAATAQRLGREDDARKYADLVDEIREAFNATYYDPALDSYNPGTQTALSCALYQGLVDPQHEQGVLRSLVEAVVNADNHIDTGILGSKYLLTALSDRGRADVAYGVASQETQPSWGWWIRQGATTLWEQWTTADSNNHIMFGDVAAWFTKELVGLKPDPAAPGFQQVIIRPNPVAGLEWARASYDSIHGPIIVSWRQDGGTLLLDASIPANVTAVIYLPTSDAEKINESGRYIKEVDDVTLAGVEADRAILRAGSGEYHFATPYAAEGLADLLGHE
jgi:alpha-L-rhamnosidase